MRINSIFFTIALIFIFINAYPLSVKANVKSTENPAESIGIRLSFVGTDGEFDIYNTVYKVPLAGIRLEFSRSYRFPYFSGFWYGAGLSYIKLSSDHQFAADTDPDPAVLTPVPFDIKVNYTAAALMGRIGYLANLWIFQLGIDFGIGGSSCYNRITWRVENPPQYDNNIEREHAFKPVFDFALKLALKIGKRNSLGLSFGYLSLPVNIDIAGQTAWGPLNMNGVVDIGLYWQTFF